MKRIASILVILCMIINLINVQALPTSASEMPQVNTSMRNTSSILPDTTDKTEDSYTIDGGKYKVINSPGGQKRLERVRETENTSGNQTTLYDNTGARPISASAIAWDDLNNFVTLCVTDTSPYLDSWDIKIHYKHYTSQSSYYYTQDYDSVKYLERIGNKWFITIGEFDWTKADSFTIFITTSTAILKTDITLADLGKTKILEEDSTYFNVNVSIPFAGSDFDLNVIALNWEDSNGQAIYIAQGAYGRKIPSGKYNVQVTGIDSGYSYCLFKNGLMLSPGNNTISFTQDEVTTIRTNINKNNTSNAIGTLTQVFPVYWDGMDEVYTCSVNEKPGGYGLIYVCKKVYNGFYSYVEARDQNGYLWDYTIAEPGSIDATAGPVVLNADMSFSANMELTSLTVDGRSYLTEFNITNTTHQNVYVNSYSVGYCNIFELARAGETYTIPFSSAVKLPNPKATADFTATYKVLGPLNVTRDLHTITLRRVSILPDNSELTVSNLPSAMIEGETYNCRVFSDNTGSNTWTAAGGYKLCSTGTGSPFAGRTFLLDSGDLIKEEESKEFSFQLTAPQGRCKIITGFQMYEGSTGFGEAVSAQTKVRSRTNPYPVNLGSLSLNSITTDKASPQYAGAKITITANATGGMQKQYRFWVNNGTGWVMLRDYSLDNIYNWTPNAAGTYQICVWLKNANSTNQYDAYKTISYTIQTAPLSFESITTDKASPQTAGTAIRITANASGGTQRVYKFFVNSGSGWTTLRDYSTNNVYDWTPATPGTYQLCVWLKDSTSAREYDLYKVIPYTIHSPLRFDSITTDKPSPQNAGTAIRITANASGGTQRMYKFFVNSGSGWTALCDYSTSNTYDWTPADAGSYQICVWLKESTSIKEYDFYKVISYTVQAAPVRFISVTTDKASPQAAGTAIRITANATGGTQRMYKFFVNSGSGWTELRGYSTNNTYDWLPADAGSYQICVWLKDSSSVKDYDLYKVISYTVQTGPLRLISVTTDWHSPQPRGTTIRITANAVGGNQRMYRFWVNNGSEWIALNDYSSTNYCDWTPSTAGRYQICAWVKNSASTNICDYYKVINYTVGP